eukprot:1158143-Pelagomonas_calceolata.AAC.1
MQALGDANLWQTDDTGNNEWAEQTASCTYDMVLLMGGLHVHGARQTVLLQGWQQQQQQQQQQLKNEYDPPLSYSLYLIFWTWKCSKENELHYKANQQKRDIFKTCEI